MSAAYNTLTDILLTFFRANPSEELSPEDIATKWEIPQRGIHTQLYTALDSGQLVRRHDDDGNYYYAAGPKIGKKAAVKPTQPSRPSPAAPTHTPSLGLDTIKFETGVPLPPTHTAGTRLTECSAMLQRMQPRQATPPLPRAIRYAIGKAITLQHKTTEQRYAMRTVGSDHVRVWRTA